MIVLALSAALATAEKRCYPAGLDTEAYCMTFTAKDGISLHAMRLPAIHPNPNPDPLFILAGGPGQAATQIAPLIDKRFHSIRTKRDLVFIDQRGTGKSTPIRCDLEEKPFSESYSTVIPTEELKTCGEKVNVEKFLSHKAAEDIELVREGYGYEDINVYAVSYGTRLALTLLDNHPKGIRKLVLDGVVANQTPLGQNFEQDADKALEKLFADCKSSDECDAAFPVLVDDFNRILSSLETARSIAVRNPETGIRSRISIDKSGFLMALRTILYSVELSAMLPFTINRAAEDDWGPFVAQTSTGMAGDLGIGLNLSIVCTEDEARLGEQDDRSNSVFGSLMRESVSAMCETWPKAAEYDLAQKAVISDIPILMLSGELDPVTPPSSAEKAKETLSGAIHLIAPGAAHNVAMTACAAKEIHSFLDGKSNFEQSCIESITRPPFFIGHYGTAP